MSWSVGWRFGVVVREGLRVGGTEYVWVQQHDWVVEFKVPVGGL